MLICASTLHEVVYGKAHNSRKPQLDVSEVHGEIESKKTRISQQCITVRLP